MVRQASNVPNRTCIIRGITALATECPMAKLPLSESHLVDGPAGKLELVLELPSGTAPTACAVICHPHPVHGGTMTNKVVHTLARAFVTEEFASLRFNFRGVGKSEGSFDDGKGEVDDVLAAVA